LNAVIPDPREAACFHFLDCEYDPARGETRLSYRFDDGPVLVERLFFEHAPWPADATRQAAFQQALRLLHLIAGVSYYKAGLCREMSFERSPGPAPANFLAELYVQGLAEFGYVNRLDVAACVNFPVNHKQEGSPRDLMLPDRALVAMGGGKDSLVGLDILRRSGLDVLPIYVGDSALVRETVKTAGLPLLQIRRQLAPELILMNEQGAWNGHVPVTAINSAILLCAAILYGCRYIVFANERSADEATLLAADGSAVNHQYSKSSAFEQNFREVIATQVSPDIEYFSILRPYAEIDVVRRFSSLKEFHPVFSSCNRNFHLDGPRIADRWCLDCPKCRFAALTLGVFLDPEEVRNIQGKNLLDDERQLDGFRALCRLGRDKPFECVGEAGESRAALAALAGSAQWRDLAVVKALAPEMAGLSVPRLEDLMKPSPSHFIPAAIMKVGEAG
jgi:hypothetical protein